MPCVGFFRAHFQNVLFKARFSIGEFSGFIFVTRFLLEKVNVRILILV